MTSTSNGIVSVNAAGSTSGYDWWTLSGGNTNGIIYPVRPESFVDIDTLCQVYDSNASYYGQANVELMNMIRKWAATEVFSYDTVELPGLLHDYLTQYGRIYHAELNRNVFMPTPPAGGVMRITGLSGRTGDSYVLADPLTDVKQAPPTSEFAWQPFGDEGDPEAWTLFNDSVDLVTRISELPGGPAGGLTTHEWSQFKSWVSQFYGNLTFRIGIDIRGYVYMSALQPFANSTHTIKRKLLWSLPVCSAENTDTYGLAWNSRQLSSALLSGDGQLTPSLLTSPPPNQEFFAVPFIYMSAPKSISGEVTCHDVFWSPVWEDGNAYLVSAYTDNDHQSSDHPLDIVISTDLGSLAVFSPKTTNRGADANYTDMSAIPKEYNQFSVTTTPAHSRTVTALVEGYPQTWVPVQWTESGTATKLSIRTTGQHDFGLEPLTGGLEHGIYGHGMIFRFGEVNWCGGVTVDD